MFWFGPSSFLVAVGERGGSFNVLRWVAEGQVELNGVFEANDGILYITCPSAATLPPQAKWVKGSARSACSAGSRP